MNKTNKNFLYSILYQALSIIFPLIITPYISRILGVENIGLYSYTYSIVYYFMLFALLGINNYGIREIAKSNEKDRSKKFFEIYSLQLILTCISILIYLVFILSSNSEYQHLYIYQGIFLISVAFDVNWFFFGIEKFKLTIIRNIIIKIFTLICIFIFIKSADDLVIYILIMSISTLISQIYLWLQLKKYIKFIKVKAKEVLKHLKPITIFFIPIIAYSIYRIMDKIMIGFIANNVELGNYDSAEKIITIPILISIALGTVMLPYMSKLSRKDVNKKINDNFKLTFILVIPIILGLLVIAPDFTNVFFGEGFVKTADIIRILLPSVLFAGITNVIRTNYLIPQDKEKIYVTSTIIGALINLILNLIFIEMYGSYGACIGTLSTEFVVMLYQILKTRKEINYKKMLKDLLITLLKGTIMAIIIYIVGLLIPNVYTKLISQILLGISIYFALNYHYIIGEFFNKEGK